MQFRHSGPRYGAWSKSKRTNQMSFNPQEEEISRVIGKYYSAYIYAKEPFIRQLPVHQDFLMPVSVEEIVGFLNSVPKAFTEDLRAVFLLRGSKKQALSWPTFAYGRYGQRVIYIHPFPKSRLRRIYHNPPKPHHLHEYRRAGAKFIQKPRQFIIEFDHASLRKFYLRDVMMHEIGHHVDRATFGKKRKSRREGYAEWFAIEYGFRLHQRISL